MELQSRLRGLVRSLPLAHRVGIVAAGLAVLMLAVWFASWVTAPSYTVLYSGLDEVDVASAIDELEGLGVPYEIGQGGGTILVPRDRLYATRASLAEAGIAGGTAPEGYELLDQQSLSISDFRQQVDYRRALEGELARTLAAMDGVDAAQVHLVLPEKELFSEQQPATTASVLLSTQRTLRADEVEAVTFLVASAVEGLETSQITVADDTGTVLHAPGDAAGGAVQASRQQRETREFEQAMAADLTALLQQATGSPASAVVRATLDFDETQTETETYQPDSQIAVREQTVTEEYEGAGTVPGGTVGVDGGPLPSGGEGSAYTRDEATREYGVDRTLTTTTNAPGKVQRLSVAIVVDDGTLTGADVPATADIEDLVSAAVGLDTERGDTIAVSTVAMPAAEVEATDAAGATAELMEALPRAGGVLVLLIAAVGLFLMSRQRHSSEETSLVPAVAPDLPRRRQDDLLEIDVDGTEALLAGAAAIPVSGMRDEVAELVASQPDEIATLLRGWLADRRAG